MKYDGMSVGRNDVNFNERPKGENTQLKAGTVQEDGLTTIQTADEPMHLVPTQRVERATEWRRKNC